ncbi:MAG TPA: cytochrome c-type biogenesis protein [Steroidobacteraceae bacterium]|nr:cytochrome c-type biogenesis protein [Steroidobacteraceae bacterium]
MLLLLMLLAAPRPAAAVDATPPMPTAQLQQRYLALTHEFRCMQCQDESLADSEVNLAGDMRLLVHDLLLQGKTDQQVRAYMVSRYGEFILMKPPVDWRNAWLWSAPAVLMLIGILVAWRVVSARTRLVEQDDTEIPDEAEIDETPPGQTVRS